MSGWLLRVAPWRRVARNVLGIGAAAIGGLALFGWAVQLPLAMSLVATWPAMRPIVACWLVLLGVVVVWPTGGRLRAIPIGCAAIVVATSLFALVQYIFHIGPEVSDVLFPKALLRLYGQVGAGRPSAHTVLPTLLVAASLLCSHLRVRTALTEALALGASLIPVAGLVGFMLQPSASLRTAGTTFGMAANAAIGVLMIAAGIIARDGPNGVHELAFGSGAAQQLVQRLLAPILFLPVIAGGILIRSSGAPTVNYPFVVAFGLAVVGTLLAYLTLRLALRISGQEQELAYRARYDALTGVVNRATFTEMVSQSLARTDHRAEQVGILYVDIDNFKMINDSYGHAGGDAVLRSLSDTLLNATRGIDVVGRLGGDEFAILMRNVQADSDLRVVAERTLTALAEPIKLRSTEVIVSATLGVARGTPGIELDELVRNADLAMYRAKHLGKGRYEMFTPELYDGVYEQQNLDAEFRSAIHRNELRVHYQPIVDLHSGGIVGVEALVRWQHPTRGLLPPAAFLGAAERSGAILPMGRWVMREACREANTWTCGGVQATLSLSINVSGHQLSDPALLTEVADALAESGLAPTRLVLEITETAIMSDLGVSLPILDGLKALGIRLAIDDFGTGYSSLSYLKQLPIDILKIDKSFVDGVAHGGIDCALARTIVALSETLSLQTIAEGVENESQREQLGDLGCVFGQGYFFSQAVTGAEISQQLEAQLAGV